MSSGNVVIVVGGVVVFADHICGSFLVREMVRYAKSNAALAFVVGLSNENNRTRTGAHPGKCILLGLGGWRM